VEFNKIERIILEDDSRGMLSLYKKINKGFIKRSSEIILNTKGKIFITSGFYILNSKAPETDGPPGTIALAKTLRDLGYEVFIITDKFSIEIFKGMYSNENVLEFPILSHVESNLHSNNLIKQFDPRLIISIERAGLSADGKYKNFKGVDFSSYNAKIDYLFEQIPNSIGIGDGGNEIGMGNYKEEILELDIHPDPSTITASESIIATTSNWGAYGLIAGISLIKKYNYLPSVQDGKDMIEECVRLGAVEGLSGDKKPWVDGRSLEQDQICLQKLNLLF